MTYDPKHRLDTVVINTGALPPYWTTMEKSSPRGDTSVAHHQRA